MKRITAVLTKAGSVLALTATFVHAGENAVSLMNAGIPSNCAEYAANVSRSEGNFTSVSPVVNGTTCYGAFQFCDSGTIQRYYAGTPQQFLNDPAAQVAAWTKYQQREWSNAQQSGLTSIIGQEICYGGECAVLTQSSILKACQFGCGGSKSKIAKLISSGMNCNAKSAADGAGTSVCKYLVSGAGYDVSCITNFNDGINCFAPVKA